MKRDITVIFTRYSESDHLVKSCLYSLNNQTGYNVQVLFLDQQQSPEIKRLVLKLQSKNVNFKYINIPAKS